MSRVGGRLADDVADDGEHVGVGRGVIAVDADFADHARRGLRGTSTDAQHRTISSARIT